MKFRSVLTGKTFEGAWNPAPGLLSAWRFTKKAIALERFARRCGLCFSFLTLTQSDESLEIGYRWITSTMQAMKKKFVRLDRPFAYVAALEIQPKRYARFGKLARHWHIVLASYLGSFPHGRYDAVGERRGNRTVHYFKERDGSVITWDWLAENWKLKHGQFFICDSWSNDVVGYLKKYLAKDGLVEELKDSEGRRIRKFSSSRFSLDDSLTDFLKEEHARELVEHPDLENLYWRPDGGKLVGRGKEIVESVDLDGGIVARIKYPRVRVLRGEWRLDVVTDSSVVSERGGSDTPTAG